MIDLTDLYQLMQCWCASIDMRARNYFEAAMGKLIGFDYKYPLTQEQSLEILKKIDAERPDLYQWAKKNKRPGGWIEYLEDVLPN